MLKQGQAIRIPNGANGEIRINYTTFKGRDYIDIRKYYLDENDRRWSPQAAAERKDELFKPTKKGIALTPEQFKKVMDVLIPVHEGIEEED